MLEEACDAVRQLESHVQKYGTGNAGQPVRAAARAIAWVTTTEGSDHKITIADVCTGLGLTVDRVRRCFRRLCQQELSADSVGLLKEFASK